MLTFPSILDDEFPAIGTFDVGFGRRSRLVHFYRWHHRHSNQAQWPKYQPKKKPDSREPSFAVRYDPAKHCATDPNKKQNLHNFHPAKTS
jgi:hypothetical protein